MANTGGALTTLASPAAPTRAYTRTLTVNGFDRSNSDAEVIIFPKELRLLILIRLANGNYAAEVMRWFRFFGQGCKWSSARAI